MKISYTHPETGNRTSITLNDRILRLWAIVNHIEVVVEEQPTDDFLYDENSMKLLKIWLNEHHAEFLNGSNNFPTFVSYFENIILLEVEHRLTRPI
jgi:spore cortex formation protein SpoVR/YcgB (stage V sporulation)